MMPLPGARAGSPRAAVPAAATGRQQQRHRAAPALRVPFGRAAAAPSPAAAPHGARGARAGPGGRQRAAPKREHLQPTNSQGKQLPWGWAAEQRVAGETMSSLGGCRRPGGPQAEGLCGGQRGMGGLEGREEGVGTRERMAKAGGASHGEKKPTQDTSGEKPFGEGQRAEEGCASRKVHGGDGTCAGVTRTGGSTGDRPQQTAHLGQPATENPL